MNEDKKELKLDVETSINDTENEKRRRKEEFDVILEKIKKMSEAIELHTNVKDAVSKEEVDNNYLNYVENSIEDKLFNDANYDRINSKILIEVVCPELTEINNFNPHELEIEDIGSHYEENENYIDKICTYEGKFVCLFGVSEKNSSKVIKYEPRKFSRTDMLQAICEKLDCGKTFTIKQYDEYYIVLDEEYIKVFSERKILSLVKVEETFFDKMKNKLTSLFHNNIFHKKKYLPNVNLIYDSNPNRLKGFKTKSKIEAKSRMMTLLTKEREVTRTVND